MLFGLIKKTPSSDKSLETILDDGTKAQIAKLIVEDVKDYLNKYLPIMVEAHFKNHNQKVEAVGNKVDANQKVLDDVLKEFKDQGDERVEHTKAIGTLQLGVNAVESHIINRNKSLVEGVKEAAKDGVHEAVPSSMQAFVEPKKNKLQIVERGRGIFGRFRRG